LSLHPTLRIQKCDATDEEIIEVYKKTHPCEECQKIGSYVIKEHNMEIGLCLEHLIETYKVENIFTIDVVLNDHCPISFQMSEDDLEHEIKMIPEFYEKSEDAQELIHDDVGLEQKYTDQEAGDIYSQEQRTTVGDHLKNCPHPSCKRLLTTWKETKQLVGFVT